MEQKYVEILKAYADHDMNAVQTGKELYMHSNTLKYHLDKIHRETGLNPNKFNDLRKLLEREGL